MSQKVAVRPYGVRTAPKVNVPIRRDGIIKKGLGGGEPVSSVHEVEDQSIVQSSPYRMKDGKGSVVDGVCSA